MQKIKATENVHRKYQKQLLAEKVVKEDDLKRMQEHISGIMSKEFEGARDYKPEVRSRNCRTAEYSKIWQPHYPQGFTLKRLGTSRTSSVGLPAALGC